MSSSKIDQTSDYARRVVEGEIVAGKYVRLACERHFEDLERGSERGIHFDADAADRAIRFFPAMFTIADDPDGKPFELLDWHKFVVGSLFGWLMHGRLRFREVYVETGKGQAKSPLMGGIGLYLCRFMGIPRAECYTVAADLKQAKIPFQDAVDLVRGAIPGRTISIDGREAPETLVANGEAVVSGEGKNAWRIEFRKQKSWFEARAGTVKSGDRPSGVFIDEVHEINSLDLIENWRAGIMKKKGNAFLFMCTNTPAADQGVCTDISISYQRMLEGIAPNDEMFGYIARVDDGDDPFENEECWKKSLPALGVTYDPTNIRGRVQQAKVDAGARLTLSRLYFGIPIGSESFWVDEQYWRACLGDIGETEGKKCYLALDLSDRNDLTALAQVWRDDDDKLQAKVNYWSTSQGIERRSVLDRIPYKQYVDGGELNIASEAVIDNQFVAQKIKELVAVHDVETLAIDPNYNLARFLDDCEKVGLDVWLYEGEDKPVGEGLKIIRHEQAGKVPIGGRKLCMPHSVERFKDKVLNGGIIIENSRLTAYCAANTGTALNPSGQPYFIKPRQHGRIDGMVALAMAVGASDGVKSENKAQGYYNYLAGS